MDIECYRTIDEIEQAAWELSEQNPDLSPADICILVLNSELYQPDFDEFEN